MYQNKRKLTIISLSSIQQKEKVNFFIVFHQCRQFSLKLIKLLSTNIRFSFHRRKRSRNAHFLRSQFFFCFLCNFYCNARRRSSFFQRLQRPSFLLSNQRITLTVSFTTPSWVITLRSLAFSLPSQRSEIQNRSAPNPTYRAKNELPRTTIG